MSGRSLGRLMACMAAVAVLLSGGGRAGATIINFDDLPNNTIVTNQYPEATFSSNPGFVNWTTAQNLGSSPPNFICTGPASGGIDCAHDVFVDFTNPVSSLNFLAVGVNNVGVVAQVDVFVNGVNTATVPIIGRGDPFTPVPVDLTAFPDVTRIAIHDVTDLAGIGWDDFSFNPSPVPEPGTLTLMGAGALGLVGYRWARRKSAR